MDSKKPLLFALPCAALFVLIWSQTQESSDYGRFREAVVSPAASVEAAKSKPSVGASHSVKENSKPASQSSRTEKIGKRPSDKNRHKARVSSRIIEERSAGESVRSVANQSSGDFYDERGEGFTRVKGMVAIAASQSNRAAFPGAIQVSGYLLVEGEPSPGESYPVVKSSQNGRLAVFTGVIQVQLRDMSFERELAELYAAEIHRSYEHLGISFLRFEDYQQALGALEGIRSHPGALGAQAELLQHTRSAR